MGKKLRAEKAKSIVVTEEMVELWRWLVALEEADGYLKWEEEGGRRREWHNLTSCLHYLFNLKPWDVFVSDCYSDNEPEPDASEYYKSWYKVRQIAAALEEAAEAEERQGRPLMRPFKNGAGRF